MRRFTWMLVLTTVGCGAIRFGPDTPPPSLAGAWDGALLVEGQRLAGTLVLRQDDRDLEATLTAEGLGGRMTGSGELEGDDRIELDVAYDVECPGEMRLVGRVLEGGARVEGTLNASDCTGTAAGTFAFTRR